MAERRIGTVTHDFDRLGLAAVTLTDRLRVDLRHYVDTVRQVVAGELGVADAVRRMPQLARVGGACPCAKSVRWVIEQPLPRDA